MAKDIFSRKDIRRFGKRREFEIAEAKPKENKIDYKEKFNIAEEEKTGHKINLQGIKIKTERVRIPLARAKQAAIFLALLCLFLGGVYLDSRFYIIRSSPQEKAESAAIAMADREIPRLMDAASLEEAKTRGYNTTITGSYLKEGFWHVSLDILVKINDPLKGGSVPFKLSKVLRVNATDYRAETPNSWN